MAVFHGWWLRHALLRPAHNKQHHLPQRTAVFHDWWPTCSAWACMRMRGQHWAVFRKYRLAEIGKPSANRAAKLPRARKATSFSQSPWAIFLRCEFFRLEQHHAVLASIQKESAAATLLQQIAASSPPTNEMPHRPFFPAAACNTTFCKCCTNRFETTRNNNTMQKLASLPNKQRQPQPLNDALW